MSSRTAVRGPVRRPLARATGVAVAAVLASATLGLGSAAAADAPVIDLGAGPVWWSILPHENTGPVPVESPVAEGGSFTAVPAAFGGSVTIEMPPELAEQTASANLVLSSSTPTDRVSYDSDSADPAWDLGLTALGGNRYRIDLPADDGSGRTNGELRLTGFEPVGASDVGAYDPAPYALDLTVGGPAAVELAPHFWTLGHTPCDGIEACAVPLTAGSSFTVSLPAGSHLDRMGVVDLGQSDWSIEARFPQDPATDSVTALTAALSADRRSATLQVPAGAVPGRYELEGVIGDGTGEHVHIVRTVLDVAAPAVNPGLRSETGGDTGAPVLLPVALGAVGVLAVAGVARSRRSVPQG
ncbi:hypothetical protein [Modestobacter sp. VKM Ac-2985]|uniref:hypothetical protein n=1 Tax=Modestobacter sp. VKM Ac-2985 TaxID=3004139 RepID=UPI0022AB9A2B|nr:hypothetical protein [Modestobacter sp. VKM Ac-2985]MCZ2836964.1 hypothetical protein [Modestobacter sp. VKM Ac-2985]